MSRISADHPRICYVFFQTTSHLGFVRFAGIPFLTATFHPAWQALDEVQRSLDLLSTSCSAISHVVCSTKTSSSSLLADTERLSRDLEAVERKQGLVSQFLDTYQLTPEEVGVFGGLAGEEDGSREDASSSTSDCMKEKGWARG